MARDAAHRGLADALVVSGVATGEPTPLGDVKRVRAAVPDRPILVGSGVEPDTVAELLRVADGAIVEDLRQARRPDDRAPGRSRARGRRRAPPARTGRRRRSPTARPGRAGRDAGWTPRC